MEFFTDNNVEAMRIDSSQRVGIGTTSPFATLSIDHDSGDIPFAIGSSTATSFIIDAAGNVGIGTSSPIAQLSIKGNGTGTGRALSITQNNANNSEIFTVLDNGRVGIGTEGVAKGEVVPMPTR